MTTLKQFSKVSFIGVLLVSFIQGKTTHRLGQYSALEAVKKQLRDLGGNSELHGVRKSETETGHNWLGGQEFPYKEGAQFLFSTVR